MVLIKNGRIVTKKTIDDGKNWKVYAVGEYLPNSAAELVDQSLITRDDEDLIACVEELGVAASDVDSKLGIAEIPEFSVDIINEDGKEYLIVNSATIFPTPL